MRGEGRERPQGRGEGKDFFFFKEVLNGGEGGEGFGGGLGIFGEIFVDLGFSFSGSFWWFFGEIFGGFKGESFQNFLKDFWGFFVF